MVEFADVHNDDELREWGREVAFALMASVRNESLEASLTAACDVVYNQWARRDSFAELSDAAYRKYESDPLRQVGRSSASLLAATLRNYGLGSRKSYSAVFEGLVEIRESKLARAGLSYSSVPAVASLMASLIGGAPTVLDPACGYGGTLLAAARSNPGINLAGVDISEEAVEFARRRLELAGFDARFQVYDWLDLGYDAGCDAIIVEPPMGLKGTPTEQSARVTVQPDGFGLRSVTRGTTDGDLLWLTKVADSLSPLGRGVVLVPDGAGYRSGAAARVRAELLRAGRVEAIIAMPPGSVLSSAVATCLWVISGEPDPRKSDHVLLVNARAERYGNDGVFDFSDVVEVARNWLDRASYSPGVFDWFARPVPSANLIESGDATPQHHLATPPEQVAPRPLSPGRLLTELRLRSFKSVGPAVRIPLKPLTLIYGRNSAGKSSLIQAILLLRQSMEAGRLTANGPSINLGSVAGLAHNHDQSAPMVVGLSFASSPAIDSGLVLPNPGETRSVDVEFVAGDDRDGAAESVVIGLGGKRFRWGTDEYDSSVAIASAEEFVEMVRHAYSDRATHPPRKPSTSNQPRAAQTELRRMGRDSVEFALERLTPHGPTSPFLAEVKHRLSGASREGRMEGMLRTVGSLFGAVGDELHTLFGRLSYLGPLRQAPQRLSARATGHNTLDVPFFLLDNTSEREDVSAALQRLGVPYDLDVVTAAESTDRSIFGDMAAVVLTDTRSGTRLSTADVGFGISQVLPIVTELSARTESIILIEQPEIHLHPAMQADLADQLIESIEESGRANQVIAETHSEALMLRIQRRIREGLLNPDEVVVLYVDQDELGTAVVRELRLDGDGDFIDAWPHGFFAERFDDIFGDFA